MSAVVTPTTPSTPMPASSTTPLQPTWFGFVHDTREALILFEAVLQGVLARVTRRPHDRERANLIRSGSIFIYEEGASGIKRWTDGVSWSPSRILNNFLIYRELEKPFPPGEKKRAKPKVKQQSSSDDAIKQDGLDSPLGNSSQSLSHNASAAVKDGEKDSKRALVGSLTESYNFKEPGGLVKKTMSVNVNGSHFHLVSYYDPDDVEKGNLQRPTNHDGLKYIRIRSELVHRQNFRAPIDDTDEGGTNQSSFNLNHSWVHSTPSQPPMPYVPAGASPYGSSMQADYLQRSGAPMGSTMSPPSASYHSQHWSSPPDSRGAYGDQRYALSAPSPVQAQNPYIPHLPQMSSASSMMRPEYTPQYQSPTFASDRYQSGYPEQDSQAHHSQSSLYGHHYPSHGSPMQTPPTSGAGHGWSSR